MVKKQNQDSKTCLISKADYTFFLFKTMKTFIDEEVKNFFVMQVRGRAISKADYMKDMKKSVELLQGGGKSSEPSEYIH